VNVAQLQAASNRSTGLANTYAAQGIAKAAALPSVTIPDGMDQAIGLQTANYAVYTALGARYAHTLGSNAQFNLGVALSQGKQVVLTVGAQWAW